MQYTRKVVYDKRDPAYPDITIRIMKDRCNGYHTWDVYYRKDGYAFQFAFGVLSSKYSLVLAFVTAMVNTADYLDMFK